MRAALLLPAADPDHLAAAIMARPDLLVIDVCDAGPQAAERVVRMARAAAGRLPVFVRICPLSQTGDSELGSAMKAGPDGIWLRRAVGRREVEQLASRLAVAEAELGLDDGATRIVASVENAAGALAIGSLAAGGPRLAGITYDLSTLSGEISCQSGPGRDLAEPLRVLRANVVFAATAAGVAAIDTAAPSDGNLDALASEAAQAGRDGFSAKLVSSPDQVGVLRRVAPQAPFGRWMENLVSGVATK
jgi:citrate lyase subunit beta / citryl-CoA lyase